MRLVVAGSRVRGGGGGGLRHGSLPKPKAPNIKPASQGE